MKYRLHLCFALSLACSPKSAEESTDTQSTTGGTIGTSGDSPVTMGHSQTSANPSEPVTTFPTTEATTVFPTTEGSATDGDPSDTFPTSATTDVISSSSTPDFTTTGSPCIDPLDQPQSAPCNDASGCGCQTGRCFVVPALGGFCGECLVDAHCPEGGCTVPNPVAGVGALCNAGKAGDGCQSDTVCFDAPANDCGVVLEVPGIIKVATCGECEADVDCPAQAPHCTPDYDIAGFTGQKKCKAPDSVPVDSGCDHDGSGDLACASGFCGEATIMNLLFLGVCGQCDSDADCPIGQQCSEPVVDLDMGLLFGSVCL